MSLAITRRSFCKIVAAAMFAPLLSRCGKQQEPSPRMEVSGPSFFTSQLLSDGIDLGTFPVYMTSEETSMKAVDKTITIPFKFNNDDAKDLNKFKLMLRLSTEFTELPICVTGWSIAVNKGLEIGSDGSFEWIAFDGQGTEAVIDLPEELNWSDVMQPTEVRVKLHVDTTHIATTADVSFPVHAILQGIE